jgi:hypothetical protein
MPQVLLNLLLHIFKLSIRDFASGIPFLQNIQSSFLALMARFIIELHCSIIFIIPIIPMPASSPFIMPCIDDLPDSWATAKPVAINKTVNKKTNFFMISPQ